ncbi:MAG: hypothetical protein LBI43_07345 [Streptococcaceae bacterium]|jgi:hypothetical protein|nr:hypothetical protein [Streptococcaceae bacterium]
MGLFSNLLGLFSNLLGGHSINDLDCDWTCDGCGANLNVQNGFSCSTGSWECTECGFDNDVSEANIIDPYMFDGDDDDDDDDDEERLDVYDAALIWESNGRDEDYTFGYTEDELLEALND